jgi:CheY-like chemotaxis protein
VPRVLVVDDESSIRFVLRVTFEGDGYDVDEAADGEAALEQMEQARPDLLVTDFMMPRMNGAELVEQLHANPDTAAIPVLLISASAGATERVTFDEFLRKPFAPDTVLSVSRRLLDGRP